MFVDQAIQIHQDEGRCLAETNPQRQQLCLAQIAQRKFEAERALYFCLSSCVDTYGAPPFMAVPEAPLPAASAWSASRWGDTTRRWWRATWKSRRRRRLRPAVSTPNRSVQRMRRSASFSFAGIVPVCC